MSSAAIVPVPSRFPEAAALDLPALRDVPLRLGYIDGIRGLAALYVVMTHHLQNMGGPPTPELRAAFGWLGHGHYAVDVFIVLSGFCLALPYVRDPSYLASRAGVAAYFGRRARRILPPYFAALGLSLAVVWLVPGTASATVAGTVAHLFLVHNLHPIWVHEINPPMWSVAVEWQIYFLLPLLIMPVRRRWGLGAAVAAAWVVGMVPHFALPPGRNLDWTFPWYVGLFALGAAAAEVGHQQGGKWASLRARVPWGFLATGLAAVVLAATAMDARWCLKTYVLDAVIGSAFAALLVHLSAQRSEGHWLGALLSCRPLVALGGFSYSLYLTHLPVAWATAHAAHLAWPGEYPSRGAEFAARLVAGTACALLVGYGFYRAAERPFLRPAQNRSDLLSAKVDHAGGRHPVEVLSGPTRVV